MSSSSAAPGSDLEALIKDVIPNEPAAAKGYDPVSLLLRSERTQAAGSPRLRVMELDDMNERLRGYQPLNGLLSTPFPSAVEPRAAADPVQVVSTIIPMQAAPVPRTITTIVAQRREVGCNDECLAEEEAPVQIAGPVSDSLPLGDLDNRNMFPVPETQTEARPAPDPEFDWPPKGGIRQDPRLPQELPRQPLMYSSADSVANGPVPVSGVTQVVPSFGGGMISPTPTQPLPMFRQLPSNMPRFASRYSAPFSSAPQHDAADDEADEEDDEDDDDREEVLADHAAGLDKPANAIKSMLDNLNGKQLDALAKEMGVAPK